MNKVSLTILLAMVLFPLSCKRADSPETIEKKVSSLARIQEEGVLRVATEFNSTSYFVYRGQPMGFQYELLQNLADYMGVKLIVTPAVEVESKFDLLNTGNVDLIAANLTVTKERRSKVDFIKPHLQTRQVLVQRNKLLSTEEGFVNQALELAGKTVYVVKNSSYASRLKNLSEEIGDSINIIEVDLDVESLIKQVAMGEIDYTVCDENMAKVNSIYFSEINVETPLSFYQNLAWAVKKGDEDLKKLIDGWMDDFMQSPKFSALYKKYYQNSRISDMVESDYFATISGTISPYDDILKKYCEGTDWDWRLLAALVFQESRFNPQARSWAGAFGVMQLMPNTARKYGVDYTSSIKQQIRAGMMLIEWLEEQLSFIEDKAERQKFVVAAYNVGLGHVLDARRLAMSLNLDPNIWDRNVAECILKKQDPEYYNREEVKYGYCRGSETYKYVSDIFERYYHYHNLVTQ